MRKAAVPTEFQSIISLAWPLLSLFAMMNKSKKRLYFFLGILALVLFPSEIGGYEGMEVTNGGMIRGVVKLQGKLSELPAPEIFKFKQVCKSVPNESIVVGFEGGVRYAVLTLQGVTKGKQVEREVVNDLDNQECRFVPHVQAASVGQSAVLPVMPLSGRAQPSKRDIHMRSPQSRWLIVPRIDPKNAPRSRVSSAPSRASRYPCNCLFCHLL